MEISGVLEKFLLIASNGPLKQHKSALFCKTQTMSLHNTKTNHVQKTYWLILMLILHWIWLDCVSTQNLCYSWEGPFLGLTTIAQQSDHSGSCRFSTTGGWRLLGISWHLLASMRLMRQPLTRTIIITSSSSHHHHHHHHHHHDHHHHHHHHHQILHYLLVSSPFHNFCAYYRHFLQTKKRRWWLTQHLKLIQFTASNQIHTFGGPWLEPTFSLPRWFQKTHQFFGHCGSSDVLHRDAASNESS